MVHTLHSVKAVGIQPFQSFNDLFTEEEFRRCDLSLKIGKTWYKLTTDVFVAFFFWGRKLLCEQGAGSGE
jgi:hypothetical protein